MNSCAPACGELTNAVYGIVIVRRHQVSGTRIERIALTHELQRACGIGRENHGVLSGWGVEPCKDVAPCLLDQARHRRRTGARGMRVSENPAVQQFHVPLYLRLRVQTAAHVIEIHLSLLIDPAVFRGAKLVQDLGFFVFRMVQKELRVGFLLGQSLKCHLIFESTAPARAEKATRSDLTLRAFLESSAPEVRI